MIISHLGGGLGNQIFQYAIGRKLSIKNNDTLKLDISAYTEKNPRAYGLAHFKIVENIATPEEIKRTKLPFGILSRLYRAFKARILKIRNVRYKPRVLNKTGNVYLSGFWQSEKYFSDIADTIRNDLTLKDRMASAASFAAEAIQKTPVSVSVHVRRTDYVSDKYFVTCSPEYYQTAISRLSKQLPGGQADQIQLFIFSDDIEWVKQNMHFDYPITYISNPSIIQDYEELVLMSKCSHHIIANSSFSWWGAWLNPNPNKIVIAPSKWFNTNPSTYRDVVPYSWIKI
ncbi:TPA: alpha-1,2-fucosyltransferase [Candidatus Taylorbacteria bacterium]|nr:alpha-1,2-fucosyltransferase [Candidatus Taylorbacteria bacterium]